MAQVSQLIRKAKENKAKKQLPVMPKKGPKSKSKGGDPHPQYDLIIIGAGVVGLAGAMYAGRMNLKTLVVGDTPIGGIITTTDIVENYPGYKKLTGLELAEKIKEHALEYKIDLEEDKVVKVERCIPACFTVFTSTGKIFHGKTLLFATGTKHRELGVPGEKELANRGIHTCALCDGPLYRNKVIGVVGGSDSAAKEALLLTQWASKVYIIYRGDKIRAEPVNMVRIENKIKEGKIEIIYNTNVTKIQGDKVVRSVIFDKAYKNSNEFQLDGLFVEIGLLPLSELAKSIGVALNQKGEIIMTRDAQTNIEGVYAAGDVGDTRFKQAITGVAEAVLAVYSAFTYLNEHQIVCPTDAEDIGKK